MQEETNEKTIALYIKTGKLTAQQLQKAMKALLAQMKKQHDKQKIPHGKQTLKQLILMTAPNKVFTKNNIFESVWNETFCGDDNAINVHISNLRKKFAKINPNEQYIQTVWGLGFKMQSNP